MSAAATLPELEPLDLDHLDTGLTHLRDRVRVPLVRHDHTWLERDDVVPVVPLLALLLVRVSSGLDDMQFVDTQCIRDSADEALLLA